MNKKLKDTLRNSWLRAAGFLFLDLLNYFRYKLLKKDLVLIYQMGKVASSSIYASLKKKDMIVYHVHRLNKAYIRDVHRTIHEKSGEIESKVVDARGIRLFNWFIKNNKRPVHIISLVRNPIERNISAFFQNKDLYTKQHQYSTTTELIDLFYKLYDHDTPLIWFDKEFKYSLNLDIYTRPFPKEEKYADFKSDNFNVLLLRVDLDDQKKEEIISNFLNLKSFKLSNKNVGHQKNYFTEYKAFKQQIELNKDYVDRMLQSKFAKHFFTETELRDSEQEWLKK